jgi:hypothetical protein
MVREAVQAGQQQPVHIAESSRTRNGQGDATFPEAFERQRVGEHQWIRHPPVQVEGIRDVLLIDPTVVALTGRQLHHVLNRRFVAKAQQQPLRALQI